MGWKKIIVSLALVFFAFEISAQNYFIKGKVVDAENKEPMPYVHVLLKETKLYSITDSLGNYLITNVPAGLYSLQAFTLGYSPVIKDIKLYQDTKINFQLRYAISELDEIVIRSAVDTTFGIKRLKDIEGTAIYAGKKNEVIVMKDITANTATNNSRQIYSKVPGLNIWESDGAGIQLGVGGRGLSPNRTSNFSTRQNGYDISADALGYPESYYSPPSEAVERIEIVRGAASLQYGTQFGGFINFKLKKAPTDKPFELITRQTLGSFGFVNSFNSVGGTVKKISYYAYYQHKQGNGWRPNSEFDMNAAYGAITYKANQKLSFTAEYTFMDYLAHQPGGLTDRMFEEDPRQSVRTRNWFKVNWNLGAFIMDYKIKNNLTLNSRFFGLIASRKALGFQDPPNRPDLMDERDLLIDKYSNWGNETRLLYTYDIKKNTSAFLIGFRYYSGYTDQKQGKGNSGSTGRKSDFQFGNINDFKYAHYSYPSNNAAVFIENIFRLSSKFSVTPGIRFENIKTNAHGFYNNINYDFAGNVLLNQRVEENRTNSRSFILAGIGLSYQPYKTLESYANFSQNYRSINFNNMKVISPTLRIDPNLQDEKGYTVDAGIRGNVKNVFNYDLSVFMINYNNKIGIDLVEDYRLSTNISKARNVGIESFGELNVWKIIKGESAKAKISVFSNLSLIDAKYISSKEEAYDGKKVELVPAVLLRTGTTYKLGAFSATYLYSYSSKQYTDATNAEFTSTGVSGLVPAYYIMDLSIQYAYKKITLEASVNNLTNNFYFTRRAEGYPGPGIIPSDGRSFYLTLQVKI